MMMIYLPMMLSGTIPTARRTSVSPIWIAAIPTNEFSMLSNIVLSGFVIMFMRSMPFCSKTWWHLK